MEEQTTTFIILGSVCGLLLLLMLISYLHYRCQQPYMAEILRQAEAKIKRAIIKI